MLDIYWNRIENVCVLKYHCMRHDSITVSTLLIFFNFLNLCFQNSILFFLIILINLFNSNVLVISLLADFGCRPYHLWLLISSCLHNPCFSNFGFGVFGGGGRTGCSPPTWLRLCEFYTLQYWRLKGVCCFYYTHYSASQCRPSLRQEEEMETPVCRDCSQAHPVCHPLRTEIWTFRNFKLSIYLPLVPRLSRCV